MGFDGRHFCELLDLTGFFPVLSHAPNEVRLPFVELSAFDVPAIKALSAVCGVIAFGADSSDLVSEAFAAGAVAVALSGFDRGIVAHCAERNLIVIPTVSSADDARFAVSLGVKVVRAGTGLNVFDMCEGFDELKVVIDTPLGAVGALRLGDRFIARLLGLDANSLSHEVAQAQAALLGFDIAHIGINANGEDDALGIASRFGDAFGLKVKNGNSSVFAASFVEVMKSPKGRCGHIAIKTNSILRATEFLKNRGFTVDISSQKLSGGKPLAVYLNDEFGGFAVHLLQKN